jgi:hypothetical protein
VVRLEDLCRTYAIPLAVVDGKALAELTISNVSAHLQAQANANHYTKLGAKAAFCPPPSLKQAQLVMTFKNLDAVSRLMEQPGRRFLGPQGLVEAASCIQRVFRSFVVRKALRYRQSKQMKRGRASRGYSGASSHARRSGTDNQNK